MSRAQDIAATVILKSQISNLEPFTFQVPWLGVLAPLREASVSIHPLPGTSWISATAPGFSRKLAKFASFPFSAIFNSFGIRVYQCPSVVKIKNPYLSPFFPSTLINASQPWPTLVNPFLEKKDCLFFYEPNWKPCSCPRLRFAMRRRRRRFFHPLQPFLLIGG